MASIHISPPVMIAAGAIWPPVCAAVVGLRFLTRRGQRLSLGIDDWLVLPALIFLVIMCVAAITGTALDSVAHPTPLFDPSQAFTETSQEQTITRIVYWLATWVQILALGCIKLSAMFFYRRIFSTGHNAVFNLISWAFIVIVALWALSFFLATVFLCDTNFYYLWTNLVNQSKCSIDTVSEMKGLAVSDVVTDALILLFPMPSIWRLQMSTKQKLAVTGIFLVGTLALAASITRLVIFIQALSAEFASSTDEDLLSTAGLYFMIIEVGFALCAVCLPSLSGTLKLQATQNFINGFTSIFSSRSSPSATSFRSNQSTKPQRLGSSSNSDHIQILGEDVSKSNPSFEMRPVQHSSRHDIQVTTDFQLEAGRV